MHLIKDENGNSCAHAHEHVHSHKHSFDHAHEHSHDHGEEEIHEHCHGHEEGHDCCHGDDHDCGCEASECKEDGCECGCGHGHEKSNIDQNTALLSYMLSHNEHHGVELDQMAAKLTEAGMDKAAEQIRKAVDEFQKGNMYLGVALAIVKEQ